MAQLLHFFALLFLVIVGTSATEMRMYYQRGHHCRGDFQACDRIKPDHCCAVIDFTGTAAFVYSTEILGKKKRSQTAIYGKIGDGNSCHRLITKYRSGNLRTGCFGYRHQYVGAAYFAPGKAPPAQDNYKCPKSVEPNAAYISADGGHTYNLTAMSAGTKSDFNHFFMGTTKSPEQLAAFSEFEMPNKHDENTELIDLDPITIDS